MSGAEEIDCGGSSNRIKARRPLLVLAVVFASLFYLVAAGRPTASSAAFDPVSSPAQKPAEEQKTTEQVYKNIQVLAGMPASELDGVMYFMSASLGVGCTHCHTNPWDSDVKSPKVAARRMILMTRSLNKESFSGNPAITCYTCHRGQQHSVPLPPPDAPGSQPVVPEEVTATKTILPPADEIIDRYTRAIGGQPAIDSVKTKVMVGSETNTSGSTAPATMPIESYHTSENKLLIVRNVSVGASVLGFDGVRGWTRDSRGLRDIEGKDLEDLRLDADFYRYLRIRQTYPQMRLLAKEKLGSRDVYVVGATSREDRRERLYFDAVTGLLVRRFVTFKTAFGGIPELTDFLDYRKVNGVMLPFEISWSRAPFRSVQKYSEIKLNVIVEEKRFQRAQK